MTEALRQRPSEVRCPYCHDGLEIGALELVECPACHTRHHVVCVEELGRCSVHGCEQELPGIQAGSRVDPPSTEVEALRRRIRERARIYVKRQALREGAPEPEPATALWQERDPPVDVGEQVGHMMREVFSPNCQLALLVLFSLVMLAIAALSLLDKLAAP